MRWSQRKGLRERLHETTCTGISACWDMLSGRCTAVNALSGLMDRESHAERLKYICHACTHTWIQPKCSTGPQYIFRRLLSIMAYVRLLLYMNCAALSPSLSMQHTCLLFPIFNRCTNWSLLPCNSQSKPIIFISIVKNGHGYLRKEALQWGTFV